MSKSKRKTRSPLAAAGREPADWQEAHSPTEPVTVTLATSVQVGDDGKTVKVVRQQERCRRRRDDARLFDSLTDKQQRAFELIGAGFRAMIEGGGWKARSLESIGRGKASFTEHQIDLRDRYIRWGQECARYRLDVGSALDVIAFGISCHALDRERRRRCGTARTNLVACLDLWK